MRLWRNPSQRRSSPLFVLLNMDGFRMTRLTTSERRSCCSRWGEASCCLLLHQGSWETFRSSFSRPCLDFNSCREEQDYRICVWLCALDQEEYLFHQPVEDDLISFTQFHTYFVNLKKVVPRRRFYCSHHFFGEFVYCLYVVAVHGHDHFSWIDLVYVHSDVGMFLTSYNWHVFSVNSFHILNKFCHFFLIFVQHFHIVDMPNHGKLPFACPLVHDEGVVWFYDKPIFF